MARKTRKKRVTYPDPDSASRFITVSVPGDLKRGGRSKRGTTHSLEANQKKIKDLAHEVAQLDQDQMREFFDSFYHALGDAAVKADKASKKNDPWRWGVRHKIGDFCTY